MKDTTLELAVAEAQRFLEKAEMYKDATAGLPEGKAWMTAGKERSSVKRASMDLTRALSDLRQGR